MGAALVVMVVMTMASTAALASECVRPRMVVLLDRSSSMNGELGATTKWDAARSALDQVLVAYDHVLEFGLATFPYPAECGPGRLELAPRRSQRDAILSMLAAPPPDSGNWTPLGETLLALAADPAVVEGAAPTYAVAITDGFQWCSPFDPDARSLPVEGVKALRAQGVKTFVVGFGGAADAVTLSAMATVAGTTRPGCDEVPVSSQPIEPCYYQADDAPALLDALMDAAAIAAEEVCDRRDNDCDGVIDEDGACPTEPLAADDEVDDHHRSEGAQGTYPGGCACGAAGDPTAGVIGLLSFPAGWVNRRRRRRGRAAG